MEEILIRHKRLMPQMTFEKPDPTLVTVRGKAQSVQQLYQDFVLGRLDPRQIGGGSYDPEGSEEVDPFNNFGMTLEEADELRQRSESEVSEARKRKQTVANAPAEQRNVEKDQPNEKPEERSNEVTE